VGVREGARKKSESKGYDYLAENEVIRIINDP